MAGFPEYDELDAVGLAALIRSGEVSAREASEAAVSRIEERNPALNAVVHRSFDRARAQADRVPEEPGPLFGVPFLPKDLHAEDEGQPVTAGSRFLAEERADHDAELVRRFKSAGLIIHGRCNTPEFGIKGTTEPEFRGPTHNPWDLERTPGGSSGGSAAAVAARMVPAAHGGDGGGSIRIPASACGLVGLKPTRGRNPMGPRRSEGWGGFVAEHVLTRSVRDSAEILDCTRGPEIGAPYEVRDPVRPFREEIGADPGTLRIAFTRDALFGSESHPDCDAAVDEVVSLCESLGHEVVEAKPSFDRQALMRAYFTMLSVNIARTVEAAQARLGRKARWDEFEAPTWLLHDIGKAIAATDYQDAIERIRAAGREVGQFFESHDIFVTSTLARPPVKLGELAHRPSEIRLMRTLHAVPLRGLMLKALEELGGEAMAPTPNTQLFNLTGQPAISLPLSWSDAGLPIGSQFVARFGDEAMLFRIASALEQAKPWKDRRPRESLADDAS
jgi:amidase